MHTRLKAEGPQWETLEERVFDQLWMDTMKRIRHEGINELSVNKYLNETQQASFGTLVSYDHALENADNRDVLDEAIWRSVFERDDHADERDVRRMSDYVRREVSDMLRRDLQDVVWGNVKWGAPPTKRRTGSRKKRGVDSGAGAAVGAVAGVAEGSTGETAETGEAVVGGAGKAGEGGVDVVEDGDENENDDDEDEDEAEDEGEWQAAMHVDGRIYWWNVNSRESRWDNPNE
jgi:hypothetical protein